MDTRKDFETLNNEVHITWFVFFFDLSSILNRAEMKFQKTNSNKTHKLAYGKIHRG